MPKFISNIKKTISCCITTIYCLKHNLNPCGYHFVRNMCQDKTNTCLQVAYVNFGVRCIPNNIFYNLSGRYLSDGPFDSFD